MEEKEIEALLDMFGSEGWKFFITSLEEVDQVLKETAVDNAVSNDQWQYCRGMIHQIRKITGYENVIKLSLEQDKIEYQPLEEDPDVDLI